MISKHPKDTEAIARKFLENLLSQKEKSHATVIGLSGELGAGKTAFTQSLGKALGISKKMSSPTFVIMKRYPIPLPRGPFEYFFHLDAYRLKNEKELLHLGWTEIISDPKNLVLIEWPENVKKAMPKHTCYIKISHTKEGHRRFKVDGV